MKKITREEAKNKLEDGRDFYTTIPEVVDEIFDYVEHLEKILKNDAIQLDSLQDRLSKIRELI